MKEQSPPTARIAITADHRGFPLKQHLLGWLRARGYTVTDHGTDAPEPRVDAMDYALKVVQALKQGEADFAIGICGDGQTMAMTANRFPFMRCVMEHKAEDVPMSREHHDANMLALAENFTAYDEAERIVEKFLTTAPLHDRYAVRRAKLAAMDIKAFAWNKD